MKWFVVFVWIVSAWFVVQGLPIESSTLSAGNQTEIDDGAVATVQEPIIASVVEGVASHVQQVVEPTQTKAVESLHLTTDEQERRVALDVADDDRPQVSTHKPLSFHEKMNEWKHTLAQKLQKSTSSSSKVPSAEMGTPLVKKPSFLQYLKSKLSSNSLKPKTSNQKLFEPENTRPEMPEDYFDFPPIRLRTQLTTPTPNDPFAPDYSLSEYNEQQEYEQRKNRHRRARVLEDQYFSSDDDEAGAWASFQEPVNQPETTPELVWFDVEDEVTEEWNKVFKSMKQAPTKESQEEDGFSFASFHWPEPPSYPPPPHLLTSTQDPMIEASAGPSASQKGKSINAKQSLQDLQASILEEYPGLQGKVDVDEN